VGVEGHLGFFPSLWISVTGLWGLNFRWLVTFRVEPINWLVERRLNFPRTGLRISTRPTGEVITGLSDSFVSSTFCCVWLKVFEKLLPNELGVASIEFSCVSLCLDWVNISWKKSLFTYWTELLQRSVLGNSFWIRNAQNNIDGRPFPEMELLVSDWTLNVATSSYERHCDIQNHYLLSGFNWSLKVTWPGRATWH
jgi:hypothetical protein